MKKIFFVLGLIVLMINQVLAFTVYGYDGTRYLIDIPSDRLSPGDYYAPYPGVTGSLPYYDDTYYRYGNYATNTGLASYNYTQFQSYAGNCSSLDIVERSVTVQSGQEKRDVFTVKNYSELPFYVDSVRVIENSQALEAFPVTTPYAFDPMERNSVELNFVGQEAEADEVVTALLEVSGHFPNGRRCDAAEAFPVYVDALTALDCTNFLLNVPANQTISKNGQVLLTVDNPLHENAVVNVRGKDIAVSPERILVKAGERGMKSVNVFGMDSESAAVFYSVEMPSCKFLDRSTHLKQFKPVEPLVEDAGRIEVVSYTDELTVNDSTELAVTLINTSKVEKKVDLEVVDLPKEITVRRTQVTLFPEQTKTVKLPLKVSGEKEGTIEGKLVVTTEERSQRLSVVVNVVQLAKAELNAKLIPGTDELDLEVVVRNNLEGVMRGFLELGGLPEDWQVVGQNIVELGPLEEKLIKLKVIPAEAVNQDVVLDVLFANNDGILAGSRTKMEVGKELSAPNVALAVLSGKATNLGVLVLLALVVYFVWRKVEKEKPQKAKEETQ